LKFRELLELMAELDERTGYPMPVPRGFASEWSKDLGLGRSGSRRLLFTGALYQLVPYIEGTVELLRAVERSSAAGWAALRLARLASGRLDLSSLVRPDPELIGWSNRVLRSMVRLLTSAGVSFDYVPELSDMYSGALLRDYGLVNAFRRHAERVLSAISSAGYEELIVVDPHTMETVTRGYSEALGKGLRAVNYMDFVRPLAKVNLRLTVHDSCVYARKIGIVERPRELLRGSGAEVVEVQRSGRWTYCCGGPLEALLPSLAEAVADARAAELRGASEVAVTMCPICYVNLRRASMRSGVNLKLMDLAEVIGSE
jgi:Fe-S oxidoreductase